MAGVFVLVCFGILSNMSLRAGLCGACVAK
jgi:hypothetical protein